MLKRELLEDLKKTLIFVLLQLLSSVFMMILDCVNDILKRDYNNIIFFDKINAINCFANRLIYSRQKRRKTIMNNWKRYELKEKAKAVLKVNYWIAFVVALIFTIISGGLNASNTGWRTNVHFDNRWDSRWESRFSNDWDNGWNPRFSGDYDSFEEFMDEFPDDIEDMFSGLRFNRYFNNVFPFLFGAVLVFASIAALFGIVLNIFVLNPLKMGCRKFFKTSAENPHKNMKDLGAGFSGGNYGSVVKTMFFRDLYSFLWSLLFVIPGIIKRCYSYRMVPYILADNPKMDANEAITLSRRMMSGHKWNAFVLDLSFLGWYILGLLAFVVGTLFVHPYYYSTDAQLYLTLRENARQEGYFPTAQAEVAQA